MCNTDICNQNLSFFAYMRVTMSVFCEFLVLCDYVCSKEVRRLSEETSIHEVAALHRPHRQVYLCQASHAHNDIVMLNPHNEMLKAHLEMLNLYHEIVLNRVVLFADAQYFVNVNPTSDEGRGHFCLFLLPIRAITNFNRVGKVGSFHL